MRIIILSIIFLLSGCGDLPDEGTLKRQGTSVTINYNHYKSLKYDQTNTSRFISATDTDQIFPTRHNIKVEPDIADIDLDEDLTAEVEVPVDKEMWVDYKNWTLDEPEIYYEYGSSDPFIVTHASPDTVTISISVDINPDYPFDEDTTDNETVDNETEETVDNETEVIDTSLLVHLKFEETHATVSGQSIVKDHSSYERVFKKCTNAYGSGNAMYDASVSTLTDAPSGQTGNFLGSSCIETEFRDNSTSPIGLSDDWTISFWIKPDLSDQDMDEWHSVLSTGDLTSNYRFQIDFDGTDKLRFYGILKANLDDDEWQFFTFTKTTDTSTGDNQKVRMYKNAEMMTYGYPISTRFDKLKIGMNRLGGGGWFGAIDDIRVYARPLDVDEIEELYESYDYE